MKTKRLKPGPKPKSPELLKKSKHIKLDHRIQKFLKSRPETDISLIEGAMFKVYPEIGVL